MAKPGYIDIGISSQFNRSARRDVNSSEGVNQTKQSVRNNQVISGGGRATSPAVPPEVIDIPFNLTLLLPFTA